jgi:hypothetical protein
MRTFKTLTAILGGAVIAAACVFVLVLLTQSDRRPHAATAYQQAQMRFQNHYRYASGLREAGMVAAAAWGGVVLIGLFAWGVLRKTRDFAADVDELYASAWVRGIGVPLVGGLAGGCLYLIMEFATATPEYPPKMDDLGPFAGGMAVLTGAGYLIVSLIIKLIRRALR